MQMVTFLWSMNAAIAIILAVVCALVWFVDRQDTAKLMFCVLALGTAAATPFELGMMHAANASEWGEQLRWYHLPIFFMVIGQMLFVRAFLGTGRTWLLWAVVSIRVFVLIANFSVQPNFTFIEISSVQRMSLLGEQVAVVGESTSRSWQWVAVTSILLMLVFVVDATIQGWRKGGEARRRAKVVCLALIVPMVGNLLSNQFVAAALLHIPIIATLWFLGTLTVIAYEFGREVIRNSRARLQLAELRREWAQVERVNSLGQLASALAHELVQPLSAARANVAAAKMHLDRDEPDLDELRSIMDDIDHDNVWAAQIIDRMRTFIKGSTVSMQTFGLQEVVEDVFSLLRHEAATRRIELKCRLPASLPAASGDRVQISQVILNLLINGMDAVQARPGSARQVVLEARAAEMETLEIVVRDSGPGIPHDRLEEIFNPLFTTKAAGLGVGLALSRMIVEAYGGRVWAENGETGGAVFRFTLPRAQQQDLPSARSGEIEPRPIETHH